MAAPQYVIAQVDENGQVRPVGPDNPLKISGGGGGGGGTPDLDAVLEQGNESDKSVVITSGPEVVEILPSWVRVAVPVSGTHTDYSAGAIVHVSPFQSEEDPSFVGFPMGSDANQGVIWQIPAYGGTFLLNQKPEIQALTPESTIADIVAALQA